MENFPIKKVVISIVGLVVVVILLTGINVLSPYERGVKVNLGTITGEVGSGFTYVIPFFEHVYKYDITNQVATFSGDAPLLAATKDIQDVKIETAVNFHIKANQIQNIYLNYNEGYKELIVNPIIQDSIKSASSQFTAEELVTKRNEFVKACESILSDRLDKVYMVLEKVSITNLTFSPAFNAAIEAKVAAKQNAERSQNELKSAEYESQAKITRSKAEAETIRIQAEAIESQGGAEYVNLKAVEKWNGVLPSSMIPGSSLPFLNIK